MPTKSIFRRPGTKHFQLVHRSQRDPLIHDPEASTHVLKEVERGNVRKGKSKAELEQLLSPDDLAHHSNRPNIGEAAQYGVYYDDTDYDYMQHLRPVGVQEDGVESVLIEAKPQNKGKSKAPINLIELPAEALPSTSEVPRNYESQQAIPSSISGFQPDMDPHLRQALEALEDDAFVGDVGDDFFGELLGEGERDDGDDVDFEFTEEGVLEEGPTQLEGDQEVDDESWEARFRRFKQEQGKAGADSDGDDYNSEGGDTLGTLPAISVIGGKKRRKGTSDASGYSMSSSSMFRNEGLTTLDERFDQIQKEYDSDEDFEDEGASDSDSEAPDLITSREDFDSMLDEFLDKYEILGGKMRQVLPGDTAAQKLDVVRKALGEASIREKEEDSDDDGILMPLNIDDRKDVWDCETILTTYSNLENHPRLIKARQMKPVPRIRLDPKTGLPVVESELTSRKARKTEEPISGVALHSITRTTVTRSKNESAEEKKARKQAVKQERQARRVDKKATKEQFSAEVKQQQKIINAREKSKLRKL